MSAKILVIERRRKEIPTFARGLEKQGFDVVLVGTGSAALARLMEIAPDLVVVNAASLRTSGRRICHLLREADNDLPILLVVTSDVVVNKDPAASLVLTLPFTLRKLSNRVRRLLPGEGDRVLHAGPIRLDLDTRRVRCLSKEARLTPRLSRLLQVMMRRPGEVLERDWLFSQVWETDYTGDTRTLDVHISWLRKAIEPNPRQPRFIKTLRGVGYRLDVEDS